MSDHLPTADEITAATATTAEPIAEPVLIEDDQPVSRRRKFARVTIPDGAYALSEMTSIPVDVLLQEFVDSRMRAVNAFASAKLAEQIRGI